MWVSHCAHLHTSSSRHRGGGGGGPCCLPWPCGARPPPSVRQPGNRSTDKSTDKSTNRSTQWPATCNGLGQRPSVIKCCFCSPPQAPCRRPFVVHPTRRPRCSASQSPPSITDAPAASHPPICNRSTESISKPLPKPLASHPQARPRARSPVAGDGWGLSCRSLPLRCLRERGRSHALPLHQSSSSRNRCRPTTNNGRAKD